MRNEMFFYECDNGAIINLKQIKSIAISNNANYKNYVYFKFSEDWGYHKTFSTNELAIVELKRLKELLVFDETNLENKKIQK